MRKPARGFTLIELIMAVGIFALLSAMAYSGLNTVLKTSAHTQAVSLQLQQLQTAISLIQQDLSQITLRSIRNDFGQPEAAIVAGAGTQNIISFTRTGWRNPTGQPRSTLQRVYYRLDEKTLIRGYWPSLDRAPNAEPINLSLLEGVESVTFEFMQEGKPPTATWPPLDNATGQPSTELPSSLRIIIDTDQWGEVSRLFPLGGL